MCKLGRDVEYSIKGGVFTEDSIKCVLVANIADDTYEIPMNYVIFLHVNTDACIPSVEEILLQNRAKKTRSTRN